MPIAMTLEGTQERKPQGVPRQKKIPVKLMKEGSEGKEISTPLDRPNPSLAAPTTKVIGRIKGSNKTQTNYPTVPDQSTLPRVVRRKVDHSKEYQSSKDWIPDQLGIPT
jgi:hypothetical protein